MLWDIHGVYENILNILKTDSTYHLISIKVFPVKEEVERIKSQTQLVTKYTN